MWRRRRDSSAPSSVAESGMRSLAARAISDLSELDLAVARVLHVNGQSTAQTVATTERLAKKLSLPATIIPRWDAVELRIRDGSGSVVSVEAGSPIGVDMDRVASAMRLTDEIGAGRIAPAAALERIHAIAHAPPTATWLFTLGAAAGAAALSVIFGVQHSAAVGLIVLSAAAGA